MKIFVPDYCLAFEYQGEHHYHKVPIYGSLLQRQLLDKKKFLYSERVGVTLIAVPYWWDKSRDSLVASILARRPDITLDIPAEQCPIPTNPPRIASVNPVDRFSKCFDLPTPFAIH